MDFLKFKCRNINAANVTLSFDSDSRLESIGVDSTASPRARRARRGASAPALLSPPAPPRRRRRPRRRQSPASMSSRSMRRASLDTIERLVRDATATPGEAARDRRLSLTMMNCIWARNADEETLEAVRGEVTGRKLAIFQ